jgi:hypothetical protein
VGPNAHASTSASFGSRRQNNGDLHPQHQVIKEK